MTQDKELEELIRNKIGETLKCFLGKEESLIIITALATAILEKYVRRDSVGGSHYDQMNDCYVNRMGDRYVRK